MRTIFAFALLALLAGANAALPGDFCKKSLTVTEVTIEGDSVQAGCSDPDCAYAYSNPVVLGSSGESKNFVGRSIGTCTVLSYNNVTEENYSYCAWTLKTAYGQISAQGEFPDSADKTFSVPITGGSGIFLGASGVIRATVLEVALTWRYVVNFIKTPCA